MAKYFYPVLEEEYVWCSGQDTFMNMGEKRKQETKSIFPGETSFVAYIRGKLDGVGPVDNRPSTN